VWQDRFLFAPGLRIAGGTDEIQRNTIAERILGLPREPRPGAHA
jgi:alkylation response protein AidB-like acyl-CoA dehydrogenase